MRILLAATTLLALSLTASAQQPTPPYTPTMTFDVASVRESHPERSFRVGADSAAHNSYTSITNLDVSDLIGIAFTDERAQIEGLPAWTRFARFNIQAKSDPSVDAQLATLSDENAWAEKQHMLQVLLADRFHLRYHIETRKALVYNLVVTKAGPKLHAAGSNPLDSEETTIAAEGKLPPIYQEGDGVRGYKFVCHRCSMPQLAMLLTGQMGAPVLDKTRLTNPVDFVLQYSGSTPTDRNDLPDVWPALTMALPDQLGLKLETSTGDRKFFIIDHVEKPSEN